MRLASFLNYTVESVSFYSFKQKSLNYSDCRYETLSDDFTNMSLEESYLS